METDPAIKTELTESGYSTLQSSYIENSTDSEDDFDLDILATDDLSKYREWYDKLLSMREQYLRRERGAFPPFPPPPLRSTIIAASQAFYINPFDEIMNSKIENVDQLIRHRNDQLYTHRFHPSDFRPLPPPHVFIRIIKTLAPHEYVDLTYALAGSILMEIGVRIPCEFPPLPPRIEPFSKWLDEKEEKSDVSSQSSSDGEYSDDSECTKMEKMARKQTNLKRREERRCRILNNQKEAIEEENNEDIVEARRREMSHLLNYKERTINEFIPPKPPAFFMNPIPNYPFLPYWFFGMPIIFYPPCFSSNISYQVQNLEPTNYQNDEEDLPLTPTSEPENQDSEECQVKQNFVKITVKKANPDFSRKKKFNKRFNHRHHKINKTEEYNRNQNYYNNLTLKSDRKSEN